MSLSDLKKWNDDRLKDRRNKEERMKKKKKVDVYKDIIPIEEENEEIDGKPILVQFNILWNQETQREDMQLCLSNAIRKEVYNDPKFRADLITRFRKSLDTAIQYKKKESNH